MSLPPNCHFQLKKKCIFELGKQSEEGFGKTELRNIQEFCLPN